MVNIEDTRAGLGSIEDLIEQYMPLASALAYRVCTKLQYHDLEELRAQAHYILAEVINRMTGQGEKLTVPYLRKRIYGAVFDFGYQRRGAVTVKARKDVMEFVPIDSEELAPTVEPEKYSIEELIAILELTEEERVILDSRLQGYTISEIEKDSGIYQKKVRRTLERLKDRCIYRNILSPRQQDL